MIECGDIVTLHYTDDTLYNVKILYVPDGLFFGWQVRYGNGQEAMINPHCITFISMVLTEKGDGDGLPD